MNSIKFLKKKTKEKNIYLDNLFKKLFPLNRSLTGKGNEKTFEIIKSINNKFKKKYFKSFNKVFDWKIPDQWEVKDAYIKLPNGKKICEFKKNNLYLPSYSIKVDKLLSLKNLKKKLFSIKNKPKAIPYVTLYYKKDWGFCISYEKLKKLKNDGLYHAYIDTKHFKGKMGYLEYLIPGKSKKEILITSYSCHPSMANNELSGLITTILFSKIVNKGYYSIRFLIIPETIGAIAYINKNIKNLTKNLLAGFNLTCIGDKKKLSYIQTREGNTYADKIIKRVFKNLNINGKKYDFIYRGSNERQFGCQNLNLPFVTLTRSKFGTYNEYHTSLDNLDIISNKSILENIELLSNIITEIEKNKIFEKKTTCEPFFTKYNLYETTGFYYKKNNYFKDIINFVAYCDRNYDTKELQTKLNISSKRMNMIISTLKKNKIIQQL